LPEAGRVGRPVFFLEDAPSVNAGLPVYRRDVGSIAHKTATDNDFALEVYHRQSMAGCEPNELITLGKKDGVGSNHDCSDTPFE